MADLPEAQKEADRLYADFSEDTATEYNIAAAKWKYQKDKIEIELDRERWKNRRRMAWLALWAMIIMAGAMFLYVPETKIEKLDEIVAWFMMAMASIVGTYIGTSTWAQVSQARKPAQQGMMATPYDAYGQGRLDGPTNTNPNYYNEQ
jgi:cation transport ATPase